MSRNDEDKRTELIKIYLTKEEKRKIKEKASQERMSISTYGRRKILF